MHTKKKSAAKKAAKKKPVRRVAKKPPPPRKLTQRQIDFCLYIVQGLTQTESYIRAGYNPNGARQNAHRLIAKDYINRELQRIRAKTESSAVLSLQDVRTIRAEIANSKDSSNQDRLTSCRDDSRTMGWDKPQVVEVKGSLIDQIRNG